VRNMSFMLTTEQVRARTKDVTRRTGWEDAKPGQLIQAVKKGMGLKRGEKIEVLATIRVKSVRRERLSDIAIPHYGAVEVRREGFPGMAPWDFVRMFCESHKDCTPTSVITRIEFEYVDPE
jgi:hypothetical protein